MKLASGAGILALVTLATGCASLMPAHPQSNMRRNERVVVEADWWSGEKSSGAQGATSIARLITLGSEKLASLFVEAIEAEAELHTAEYTARLSAEGFYANAKDDTPDLKSITIRRLVDVKGEQVEALRVKFLTRPASEGNGAFQLVPVEGLLTYSKAKVADTRWYLPWTWFGTSDGKIDVDVQVVIDASWVTPDLKFHRETIGDVTMPLRMMRFDEAWNAESVFKAPRTRKETLTEREKSAWETAGMKGSDFLPLVPRSQFPQANGSTRVGNGMFTIRVRVKEFDDYGERVSKFAEAARDRRDELLDKAESALGSVTETPQRSPNRKP